MPENKLSSGFKPASLIPQLLMTVFWIAQIFMTIDNNSFFLSFANPIPYKNAYIEDFSLYYIVYSAIFIFIIIISLIKPPLAAIPISAIFLFEAFSFASPIIYKYLNLGYNICEGYALSLIDPTNTVFYSRTLKALFLVTTAVLLVAAMIVKKKKTVLILFFVAFVLLIGITAFQTVNLTLPSNISKLDQDSLSLIPKSIAVGFLRVLPYLPIFFIGYGKKEK